MTDFFNALNRHTNIQPYTLNLAQASMPAQCDTLHRLLPKRRAVFLGTWQAQKVVIKCFFHRRHAKRDFMREHAGLTALIEANIPTPAILYAGQDAATNLYVIITRFIDNAPDLGILLAHTDVLAKHMNPFVKALKLLAHCHKKGLLHLDCHLKNFLIGPKLKDEETETVYLLDGDAVRKIPDTRRLPLRHIIENIALFLTQLHLPLSDATLARKLILAYMTVNPLPNFCVAKILASVYHQTRKREKQFLKKIKRNCSQFIVNRTFKQREIIQRHALTPALEDFLAHPTTALNAGKILKQSSHSRVVQIQCGDKRYVVKQYDIKNPWDRIKQAFKASRAWRAWRNTLHLRWHRIPTPNAIAFKENRWGPLRGQSMLVMEYIPGVQSRAHLLAHDCDQPNLMNFYMDWMALFNRLGDIRVEHRDMKPNNFLYANGRLYVIDLDAMRQYPRWLPYRFAHQHDLKKWIAHWPHEPEIGAMFEPRGKHL